MKKQWRVGIFICFIYLLIQPTVTSAHSGRTDSYGGHNKNANGTYHCHSGKCLKDAWNKVYNEFYPIGLEDGPTRNDQSKEIENFIWSNYDSDQAEYIVPYALKSYKMGFEETYEPTLWEEYQWYIVFLSALTLILLGLAVYSFRKLILKNTTSEKKIIFACILFYGGWIFIAFTLADYLQGMFLWLWLFTLFLLMRFIYQEGVIQMKEERVKSSMDGD